ncbi:MAG: neutral zinc metallopeptidase [Myxococcota bacterium]
MRWQRGRRSQNLEDRRGNAGRGRLPGFPGLGGGAQGGRVRIPMGGGRGGGLSLGGLVLMLGVAWLLGVNPLDMLGGAGGGAVGVDLDGGFPGAAMPEVGARPPATTTPAEEELVEFVSFVLDDLQATWGELLPGYRDAKLVLFRDATPSACGMGQSAMGPFYCPGDQKVYVDLAFYDELRQRFGAPGDFAQAYVLAHEIGHHVQRLTGVEEAVRREQRAASSRANELSVRMELQADCLAGVWGHATSRRGVLEPGDVEEGLRAAAAIGDDRIQRMSGRGVQPESFTHGSSEQRTRWLRKGLESGDPNACDTFEVSRL